MADHSIPGVVFRPRSHQGMQRGINQMVDVVRPTLGPRPRVVAVENVTRTKTPELLDDAGVISRRIIQLRDRDEDVGAMLVRHLLWRLHEEVGDGTATAAVLFQTVYNRGLRHVTTGGNVVRLRRYLEQGMHDILDGLDGLTTPIAGQAQLEQLAESLCFDPPLAQLLGEIFDTVGEYGQVEVRTGQGRMLERHYVEGMYWKSSVVSPRMLADQVKLRTDLVDAALVISDLEIDDPHALVPLLDIAMASGIRALVIIAGKLSESAIALLLSASREPEKFHIIAVTTPGFGLVEQAAAMEDLMILTGGRRFLKVTGDTLRGVTVEDLGRVRRASCDRLYFGIVGGKGNPRRLRAHIGTLRAAYEVADDRQTRTRLQERIGKLMGGAATLVVGGSLESEIEARAELARRTASLLRTALREGVVVGGGVALLACRDRLECRLERSIDPDEQAAYRILLHALEEPIRTIIANAGFDPGEVMEELQDVAASHGFDARCGQIVDLEEADIYDVAAAQKAAVRGAITTAAMALTVDVLVHKRKPEGSGGRP